MAASLASLYDDHFRIQQSRTDAALAAEGFAALAIHAGQAPMQFLDDQPYPFKPNPHFKLWTPLADAIDSWIVYRPARKPQLIFLQPRSYWHQPPTVPEAYWTAHFEILVVHEASHARTHIADIGHCACIAESPQEFGDWNFAACNPPRLLQRLHYPRARKTAYEIECMRAASRLAATAHRAAEAAFRSGASEYDIHLVYLQASRQTDNELPYSSIVALNEHAAVLHYQHQQRRAPDLLRSLLIDAGAQSAGYAADVTRTFSAAQDDFAALIRGMDNLQQALCSQVRPGVDYTDIHLAAHRMIASLLRESGLISSPADEAVESGLSSVFFPHGVGHLLGLQVHDVAGFMVSADGDSKAPPDGHPYLRLTRTLEPGFVVTIEPGLYFSDALLDAAQASAHAAAIDWKRVATFRPYGGIRIEDNVVCTANEPENLTRDAFAKV